MKEAAMKVVICDDHDFYRSQLKRSISQFDEIDVMAEAANGIQLLSILSRNLPDVVLLDLHMPVMDGFSALSMIRKKYPALHVFILTFSETDKDSLALSELGVSGFISKDASAAEVLKIFRDKCSNKLRLTA